MRKILIFTSLLLSIAGIAQPPGVGGRTGMGTTRMGGQNMNIGHFYGKIVDSKTNKGVDGVTVQLTGNKFDTVKKAMKQAVLKTVISAANGDFSLEGLPVFGNFKLKITAIGYKTLEQPVTFGIKMPQGGSGDENGGGFQNLIGQADKDLGNIKITADASDLGNVTVTTSAKQLFELGVDRKIYNVDKDLTASGQTATEIMKNIPSVNVDIDGNVSLRNAAPTIFVDGRPTTLTLDQIPAEIIEKVEIITNPSAKFDASGGTAGILNIVLKKNKKVGYNGGVRTGIDSRGRINLGGDINLRQQKVNMFLSGNFNQRRSLSWSTLERNNFGSTPSFINNSNDGTNDGYFGFFRGGLDYFADNRNTISFAANYNRGQFNNESIQRVDSTIYMLDTTYNLINSNSKSNFQNFGAQLSYKHNFAKNGHNIGADFNYNSSTNNNESYINTYTYKTSTNLPKYNPLLQQTLGDGYNRFYTLQADYENPITETTKFEAGVRAAIRDFGNNNNQYRFNTGTNQYELVAGASTKYKYNDQVYAAYGTYSFKVKKFSFQLGLRAESSNYTGTLLNTANKDSAQFKVQYALSLFPSTFITYKVDSKQDIQFNYSRKINRPNFFQLMPFADYTDPQNINMGNAGLRPEFTNSFEVSYNNAYKKGSNFLASIYFKHNTDLITRYIYKDVNQLTGDSAYFNTYLNANTGQQFGLELTNRMPITKWWDMTANVNLFNSKIDANIPGQAINNSLVSWFGKINNTFKVAKGWTVQLSGDYQARTVLPQSGGGGGRGGGGGGMMFGGGPQITAQGYILPRYSLDISVRKDFSWKGGNTASITVSMNDFLRTQMYNTYSESPFFVQTSERRRDPQVLRVNFNWRFGKFDPNLFKRKNNKADQGGGMDMMGGS